MRRGTTPRLTLRIRNFDLGTIEKAYISLECGNAYLEFTNGQYDIVDDAFVIHLSQEQTLQLDPKKSVNIQVRIIDSEGEAFASTIGRLSVQDIIKDGVIS